MFGVGVVSFGVFGFVTTIARGIGEELVFRKYVPGEDGAMRVIVLFWLNVISLPLNVPVIGLLPVGIREIVRGLPGVVVIRWYRLVSLSPVSLVVNPLILKSPSIDVADRRCGVTFSDARVCSVTIPSLVRKLESVGDCF